MVQCLDGVSSSCYLCKTPSNCNLSFPQKPKGRLELITEAKGEIRANYWAVFETSFKTFNRILCFISPALSLISLHILSNEITDKDGLIGLMVWNHRMLMHRCLLQCRKIVFVCDHSVYFPYK